MNKNEQKYFDHRRSDTKKYYDKWCRIPQNFPEMGIILDNQSLASHQLVGSHTWKSNCVEVAEHVFKKIAFIKNMISIQPLRNPHDMVFFERFSYKPKDSKDDYPKIEIEKIGEEIIARTRALSTQWDDDIAPERVAICIANEVVREIVTDLKRNAGTIANWTLSEDCNDKEFLERVYSKLIELSGVIHRKTLRGGATWIYTSKEIGDKLCLYDKQEEPKTASICGIETKQNQGSIYYRGRVSSGWKLYIDTEFESNTLLIGHNGSEHSSEHSSEYSTGYIYCPYIPIGLTSSKDQEGKFRIITRYAKKMPRDGAKHYALLKIDSAHEKPLS